MRLPFGFEARDLGDDLPSAFRYAHTCSIIERSASERREEGALVCSAVEAKLPRHREHVAAVQKVPELRSTKRGTVRSRSRARARKVSISCWTAPETMFSSVRRRA
jgi:hypothetical protein